MRLLKQSTAFTFRIGPFLDDTDGKTAETGLTISQADIQISKNGGAFAQTSDASPTTTHDTDGWYQCPLTTTDTGTLGPLTVQVTESGALPVWEHFMVVPANTYDSLVSGSDYLQADTVQVEGSDATDQINAACDTALTDYDAVVPADLPTNFGDLSITATTGRVDVASVAGTAQTANDNGADINAILTDTADMQPRVAAIETDTNELQGDWVNGGRLDLILDAIQADTNELQTDDVPGLIAALNDPTAAAIADAVWDEAQSGHTGAGTFGEIATEIANILADTDELQTDDVPGLIAALNDISAADVWDSSSATLSLSFENIVDRIYRFLMNKMTITDATGTMALRNEADSADIATSTNWVTDDDTTTTRVAVTWS